MVDFPKDLLFTILFLFLSNFFFLTLIDTYSRVQWTYFFICVPNLQIASEKLFITKFINS